ncbi:YccS family putative transporter [Neisseria musculi]|uniref:Integral membrane YccS/YhfK family protein n=1 Tax=Neisseria musculi TaxID=1815583 RepID=A0A7H1MBW4_9NEIS|nr:YccS family putative transporter [Neisseria musculi]QNT59129.1 integral membrane, YccS/YhfK family protein [Neisseria musculi]
MRTPAVNPKIIATLPVFFSVLIATVFIWYFNVPKLTTPFVLGIIAGGLVDLDNRLTGRLKNIVITVVLFSIASLSAQITYGSGLPFILAMTLLTLVFTLMGAVGLRYRTLAFGALAVATYTTLSYTPGMPWGVNPLMILCGTLLYSVMTLILHIVFPHRPVQENMAAAYSALGGYLDAKAEFFDPDETEQLENRQIDLAMKNTAIIEAFNRCRNALFYRMRGQHRHPRTSRMLRYYFTAQDIHERISSTYMDYRELAETLKNTDLIFRIHRLLELQAQACRDVAESLRSGQPYQYSKRLQRAIEGCRQSLKLYAAAHGGGGVHTLQRLLENLFSVDYQLSHIESGNQEEEEMPSEKHRIAGMEGGGLRNVWRTVRSQLNFESAVFRHAVRLAVVVFTACTIVEVFHIHFGYWILLTAVFVCQPNYSATKSRINQRIAGTVLGVLAGSLVPYFTPSVETKLWIVLAATTLFFFFRTFKYSFSTFFITVQALTALSLAGEDVFSLTWHRMADTLIGSAIAWGAVSYLWPDWHYLTLERTAAQAVSRNGVYLRHILGQLQNGGSDDMAYRVARRRAHEAAASLSSTLSDMSGEPKKYAAKLQDGFTLLKTSHALIGYISALGAYRNQITQGCAPEFGGNFYRTAYQAADMLENLAAQPPEAFQTASEQIRQELAQLHGMIGSDRQSSILWQQLNLIARQLEPCYRMLHNTQAGGLEAASA